MVTGVNSSRTGGWMLDKGILDPSGLLGFSENSFVVLPFLLFHLNLP